MYRWKQAGRGIEIIRCDNAGENEKLQERAGSADWKLDIEFEYTVQDTPQQNHLAELGFATLYNKGRAMLIAAKVPQNLQYKLSAECFKTATLLDGLMAIKFGGKIQSRYEHWCGKNPDFSKYLRPWGEAGTVKLKGKRSNKLSNQGKLCVMVGYATDHPGNTYRMWNPVSNGVHVTRDVIWHKKMYFEMEPVAKAEEESDSDSDDDAEEDNPNASNYHGVLEAGENEDSDSEDEEEDSDEEDDEDGEKEPLKSGRVPRPPERLTYDESGSQGDKTLEFANQAIENGYYEIKLTKAEENYYSKMADMREIACSGLDMKIEDPEVACVGAALGGGFANTNELKVLKYKEAMAGPDKEKWEEAVHQEYLKMEKHQVFQPVPKKDLPDGAKVLTSTWAMKKKANGTFRARINGRGYEQVDGEHYNEADISAPVVNEITIRIILILMILGSWTGTLVDVIGAFLNGRFGSEERVYMEVPEGFEKYYGSGVVLFLLRTIYGLKNSAMAYWKETLMAFKSMKFQRSKADPCLQYKWTDKGLVLWVTWVDDCLCVGPDEAVAESKKQLESRFDVDDLGPVQEYVGCKIDYDRQERAIKITQPVLLQSFEDEFELSDGQFPNTPAVPGEVLRSVEERNQVDGKLQKLYRKGVGKLLHLKRWSRPEIGNAVRALSKFGARAGLIHLNAMKRTMKYCLGTRHRGVYLKPWGEWDGSPDYQFTLRGKLDLDFAKDEM